MQKKNLISYLFFQSRRIKHETRFSQIWYAIKKTNLKLLKKSVKVMYFHIVPKFFNTLMVCH